MDKQSEDLLREYKKLPTTSGVYMITDTIQKRSYVGSSVNVKDRVKVHLKNTLINNPMLFVRQKDMSVKCLEVCSKELLLDRELFYIKKHKTFFPKGFNITDPRVGFGGCKCKDSRERKRLSKCEHSRIPQHVRIIYYKIKRKWILDNYVHFFASRRWITNTK